MSKKAGLRFGKTRPQLNAVTGATVLCAASGASMPYTRKCVGGRDGGQATWSLRCPHEDGGGPCLVRPSFGRRLFQDEPTFSRRLADRLLRGDWATGARGLIDGNEAIGSEDL